MATFSDDRAHAPRSNQYNKPTRQPREERARIPSKVQRIRPAPLNVRRQPPAPPSPDCLELSVTPREDVGGFETPRAPEIVDLAAPSTWPRRGLFKRVPSRGTAASPSIYSRCSTARQSEVSFGILDYYTRDHSPLHSPELPPPTPKVDPALDRFDFELIPQATQQTPVRGAAGDASAIKLFRKETIAGAEVELPAHRSPPARTTPNAAHGDNQALVDLSPPSHLARSMQQTPKATHKKTYSLFPTIKETTPVPKAAQNLSNPHTPTDKVSSSPTANLTSIQPHQQPDPSYRPRKESLTSSVRSRKDSCTSFRSNCRVPLRILSSSSTTSGGGKTDSTLSTSSPPERSRWSDDTITSPTVATTPGPRTSFSSLLAGRDSAQYPACFFEDDGDERMPLRRKFAWKRSASMTYERQAQKRNGRFDDLRSLSWRLKRIMLCGGCCSARRVTETL